jgi:hypothetical protein
MDADELPSEVEVELAAEDVLSASTGAVARDSASAAARGSVRLRSGMGSGGP